MHELLKGYKVIEVATWAACPGAGAILADFGADVIKIEPPVGDPYRGLRMPVSNAANSPNVAGGFEGDNRSKRSMALRLKHPEARKIIHGLVKDADIFLTNVLRDAQEEAGFTYEALSEINPRLVYLGVSGFGTSGPDAAKPGYDHTAFWARAGMMGLLGEEGDPPILHRGADGDHTTSIACVAGVLAALLDREKTGKGQFIDVSLLGTGLWVLGNDVIATLLTGQNPRRNSQRSIHNPLWTTYLTKDDRWILLSMAAYQAYWPTVARAIGRPELADDSRYKTMEAMQQRIAEMRQMLTEVFAQRTLKEWGPILDEHGVAWAPVAQMTEVVSDPQVRAMNFLKPIDHPAIGKLELPAAPFQFSELDVRPRGHAPELGQHTEEVLLELGYSWDEIISLREAGALGD